VSPRVPARRAGSIVTPHEVKVRRYLEGQGYSADEAHMAVARAITSETGSYPLRDHYAYFDGIQYASGPAAVLTAADIAAAEARSLDAAVSRAVSRAVSGRYPTASSSYRKLGEEFGELGTPHPGGNPGQPR
jgi:hypothetical protein